MDEEVKLPRFNHTNTTKPMISPIWLAQRRRWQRRHQFVGDFGLGVFFTITFAIVTRMMAGR
jgi:hypothetical protein